jgi:hypothetical protein
MSEAVQPQATDVWKSIISDEPDLLRRVTQLFDEHNIPYCVIGGQAVSTYVEPVISLDLDLVVPEGRMSEVEALLQPQFQVRRFRPFFSISMGGSDFRVQIQSNAKYADFIERAAPRSILGMKVPVACLEDVFMSKIWAAMDPARRASKRQKDLADIARFLDVYPHLLAQVPDEVKAHLLA